MSSTSVNSVTGSAIIDEDGMATPVFVRFLNQLVSDINSFTGGGSGEVFSVNGETGVVVLDADDISDTSTINKFTTASEISKLAGIEIGADVTDTINVTAAGAVMDTDIGLTVQAYSSNLTSLSLYTVLDEDTMASDSVTALPTQQSVKAYVDTSFGAVSSVNGETGVVVLTQDDIGDGSTYVQYSAIEQTKLSGIEALADVTDATNVEAAGAVMDSDIGVTVQAYSSILDATTASYTTALNTKLSGIEALADVTDTTNVTAAGALMDSEVTSLSGIKTMIVPDSTTISSYAASFLDDTDEATFKATVNLEIGTDVQAYSSNLTSLANNTLAGDLYCSGNDITDVQRLIIDATPDTDETATGNTTVSINAGTTISAFQLCYLASDGEWALTDADASSTAIGMLALALESGTDGNPIDVALAGSFVRDDTWAWTVGGILYVSTTAGEMTQTAPSGTGDIVRVVGYAVTADIVYFNPDGAWVEVA